MTKLYDPQLALETAREILNGLVCECGCVESEHLMLKDTQRCNGRHGRCRCPRFAPVTFTVERATSDSSGLGR